MGVRAMPRPGVAWLAVAGVAAAGITVAVVAVAANRGDTPVDGDRAGRPAAWPSVSPPTDPTLDYRDPTAVCLRFADAVYRRDTRTDTGPQAAYRRATAYTTGDLAAAVAAQPDGRDPHWSTWRAHRAATDPTVTAAVPDGDVQPADTTNQSYRVAQVTLTAAGTDGWRGPTEQHFVFCTLRGDPHGWRVERYQLADGSGTP